MQRDVEALHVGCLGDFRRIQRGPFPLTVLVTTMGIPSIRTRYSGENDPAYHKQNQI